MVTPYGAHFVWVFGCGLIVSQKLLLSKFVHCYIILLCKLQSVNVNIPCNKRWMLHANHHRPLSRCLDRCDRMIQTESSDPNGGNASLFSAATCTSQCKLRPYAQMPACQVRNLHCGVHVAAENKHTLPTFGSLASLSIAMAFSRQRPIPSSAKMPFLNVELNYHMCLVLCLHHYRL